MGHDQTYEEKIKGVYKGLFLLGFVTLIEVGVSLFGKGHLGFNPEGMSAVLAVVGILLIVLSLYKAYFIIYEFMHMGHEMPGLRMTVLMPCLLLVWAIIAFFQEGNAWFERRDQIKQKNEIQLEDIQDQGSLHQPDDTKYI